MLNIIALSASFAFFRSSLFPYLRYLSRYMSPCPHDSLKSLHASQKIPIKVKTISIFAPPLSNIMSNARNAFTAIFTAIVYQIRERFRFVFVREMSFVNNPCFPDIEFNHNNCIKATIYLYCTNIIIHHYIHSFRFAQAQNAMKMFP